MTLKLRVRDIPKVAGPLAGILTDLKRLAEEWSKSGVSRSDLVALGLATDNGTVLTPPVDPGEYTTPPIPVDVRFTVAVGTVIIEWSGHIYAGHSHTEVWRSPTPDLADASIVGTSMGGMYADPVGIGRRTLYYWLRFVNKAGKPGPFHSQVGQKVEIEPSVQQLIDLLSGMITATELHTSLGTRIDLIDGAGAGSVNARISAEKQERVTADGAEAMERNKVSAVANGAAAAVQEETIVRARQTGELYAQYTIKTDVGGLISGFGLASTAGNAPPTSLFGVRASTFYVAPPTLASRTAPTANLYKGFVWLDTSVTPNVTRHYTGTAWSTEPQSLPFIIQTAATTINGETIPPGVYMEAAYMARLVATRGQIGLLAVDDARIANMSVAKLKADALGIGEYIESTGFDSGIRGFRISGSGDAEFNNAVMRGSAYVGNGALGGILINQTGIQSSNYNGSGIGFRLSSDGRLHLPGGSVDAAALNVGDGANLIAASTFANGAAGWSAVENIGGAEYSVNGVQPAYRPVGTNVACIYHPNASYAGTDIGSRFAELTSDPVSAEPGVRYCLNVETAVHRCFARAVLAFYNAAGSLIAATQAPEDNTGTHTGGQLLSAFKSLTVFAAAPAGTASMRVLMRKGATRPGNANSWMFFCRPMLTVANANQTVAPKYGPSGMNVKIRPEGIETPSLAAITGIFGDVHSGSLRGGAFSGYGWPQSGGGFYLGPQGLLIGNYNTGRYFQVEESGNIYMPGMSVVGGTLTINALDVIDTVNVRNGAVATAFAAEGNPSASIGTGVPTGQNHRYIIVASCAGRENMPSANQQSLNVIISRAGGGWGPMARSVPLRVVNVITSTDPPASTRHVFSGSMQFMADLPAGNYSIECTSNTSGESAGPVFLAAIIAKKP